MATKTTIYFISGSISEKGLTHVIKPLEVIESAKSYKTTYLSANERIDKTKIMVVDSYLLEKTYFLKYFTYCLEGDQQKALNAIKEKIVSKVAEMSNQVKVLQSFL